MTRPVIVLAADDETRHGREDEQVLVGAFEAAGASPVWLPWGEPLPERTAAVLLRTTWDYIDRFDAFHRWLDGLDAAHLPVWNPTELVRWNSHKGYLAALAAAGVAVIPTVQLARHSRPSLAATMAARGWDDAVVKPAVGAGSKLAIHVGREGPEQGQRHLDALVVDHDVLVQPFLPEIAGGGELSIVVVDGAITHVVRKQARPGEWRIQSTFGGRASLEPIAPAHRAVARAVIAALPSMPLYARIDVVEVAGALLLMEVELIEPELWFALAPDAAAALAAAVLGRT